MFLRHAKKMSLNTHCNLNAQEARNPYFDGKRGPMSIDVIGQ